MAFESVESNDHVSASVGHVEESTGCIGVGVDVCGTCVVVGNAEVFGDEGNKVIIDGGGKSIVHGNDFIDVGDRFAHVQRGEDDFFVDVEKVGHFEVGVVGGVEKVDKTVRGKIVAKVVLELLVR